MSYSLRAGSGWNCNSILILLRKLSANLYDIYHCCVYSEKIPDDGQRNCPKHVHTYSKNKFQKLMCLVGFVIRDVSQYLFCVFQLASKAICICGVAFFCQASWSVYTTCRANSWSSYSVRWVTLLWCMDSLQQKSHCMPFRCNSVHMSWNFHMSHINWHADMYISRLIKPIFLHYHNPDVNSEPRGCQ